MLRSFRQSSFPEDSSTAQYGPALLAGEHHIFVAWRMGQHHGSAEICVAIDRICRAVELLGLRVRTATGRIHIFVRSLKAPSFLAIIEVHRDHRIGVLADGR